MVLVLAVMMMIAATVMGGSLVAVGVGANGELLGAEALEEGGFGRGLCSIAWCIMCLRTSWVSAGLTDKGHARCDDEVESRDELLL